MTSSRKNILFRKPYIIYLGTIEKSDQNIRVFEIGPAADEDLVFRLFAERSDFRFTNEFVWPAERYGNSGLFCGALDLSLRFGDPVSFCFGKRRSCEIE